MGPPRIKITPNDVKLKMKTNKAAAVIAGPKIGRVILRKVVILLAPRILAA